MNPLMAGLCLGKSLGEGDYLGASVFLPDLLKSLKAAAPSILKNIAGEKLSQVASKLQGRPAGPAPVESVPVVTVPVVQPMTPLSHYVVPAGALLAAVLLVRHLRKGGR